VRLLKVHLLKPLAKYFIKGAVSIASADGTRPESEIAEGATCHVIISCTLSKALKPETRLKAYFAVEDQLANKHQLPPIVLKAVPKKK